MICGVMPGNGENSSSFAPVAPSYAASGTGILPIGGLIWLDRLFWLPALGSIRNVKMRLTGLSSINGSCPHLFCVQTGI